LRGTDSVGRVARGQNTPREIATVRANRRVRPAQWPQDAGRKESRTMKHYVGERTPQGCEVEVIDKDVPGGGYPLLPRFDLRNHSPTGFEWGYAGSGPAQLSLALLI